MFDLNDIEKRARAKLRKEDYDFIAGGADREITLRRNKKAFNGISILPRALVDVEDPSTDINLLNIRSKFPIFIAPMAFHGLMHKNKELETTKAANETGTLLTVSTMTNVSLEEIAQASTSPLWFQLYVHKNRNITYELINRAEKAGYKALVITIDVPQMGNRLRDKRNQFKLPEHLQSANFIGENLMTLSGASEGSRVIDFTNANFDRSLTWMDIEKIKAKTKLPIILKGIMHPNDALMAIERGVSAIIVSNHGGRQLDSAPATIEVLPEIVMAVKGRIPVLIDGGIRHGNDIFKALALGASAVMVGRPILWGLALGGSDGVKQVLNILCEEFKLTMQFCGCKTLKDINQSCLWRAPTRPMFHSGNMDLKTLMPQSTEESELLTGQSIRAGFF